MTNEVLLVGRMPGIENCARALTLQLNVQVQVAADREGGLHLLRRGEFGVVVVEESLMEGDPAWADQMWKLAGLAIPLEINFAFTGCARLAREVRAALNRRDCELAMALRSATAEIENELKSSVTGLLLASELASREPSVPLELQPKMRHLVELASAIRERLRGEAQDEGTGFRH